MIWSTFAPASQRASTIGVKPLSLAIVRAVAPSWIEINIVDINTVYAPRQWNLQVTEFMLYSTFRKAVPISAFGNYLSKYTTLSYLVQGRSHDYDHTLRNTF